MYRVSFTGYRPQKLPFFSEEDPMCVDLKNRIYRQVEKLYEHGADDFYTGMALGVDMWCAEAVLRLREIHPEVRLNAVIPCRGQESRWSAREQQRYQKILAQCSKDYVPFRQLHEGMHDEAKQGAGGALRPCWWLYSTESPEELSSPWTTRQSWEEKRSSFRRCERRYNKTKGGSLREST